MGYKRTFCDAVAMSALPPKANIRGERKRAPSIGLADSPPKSEPLTCL
jgi:hypothetical protein